MTIVTSTDVKHSSRSHPHPQCEQCEPPRRYLPSAVPGHVICARCGALVAYQKAHNRFHDTFNQHHGE